MKKLLTLFTLLLTVCSGAWGASTYEVYFIYSTDATTNGTTQSTVFSGCGSASSTGNSFGFTVDGTSYTAAGRTGNSSNQSISFSLPSGKTGRLWAIHNQSGRHFSLTGSSSGSITRITENTGFSSSGSNNAYADVFDITSVDDYTLANGASNNIGLIALILRIDDAAPTDPTGSHTLTWNVMTGTTQETLQTKSKTSTSTYLTSLSDISVNNLDVTDKGKENSSPKIETPASEDAAKYTYVRFQVADGYAFKINEIDTKLVAVTDAKTVKLEISDNNGGTTQSLSYSHSKDSDPGTAHEFNFNENNCYSGTVTIKLYVYGATSTYRMGKPLTIKGDVTLTHVPVTITDLSAIEGSTYTGKNYATLYYSDVALAVPSGVKAYTYKMDGEALVVSRTYENGGTYPVIPAGEAVVVESDAGASYNFNVSTTETTVDTNSLLKGTDASTTIDESGYKYYKLAMNDALTSVGFYFAVVGGTSITNGAHKAYLRVSTTASKEYFVLGGEGVEEPQNETDGINAVDIAIANGATIYNLAGQKVGANYKGIVVINGKKVVRK